MQTQDKISAKYLAIHNASGTKKAAEDKELFDREHRQIWQDCDNELKQRKDELKGKTILTSDEQQETEQLEQLFPTYIKPESVMDYKAEILKLQDEVKKLKEK